MEEHQQNLAASPEAILETLVQSVSAATNLNGNPQRADPIVDGIIAFVDDLMKTPKPAVPGDDHCTNPDPVIKPLCSARRLARAQADIAFGGTQNTAAGALYTAVSAWSLAVSTYENKLEDAQITLHNAVDTAKSAYQAALKLNPDSASRTLTLWFTLKAGVTTAVAAYETTMATAGGTLAGAVGVLMTAYISYIAAISGAEATRISALCAADLAFWNGVEKARDH